MKNKNKSLARLTQAALILPGLIYPTAHAAEEDSVDFQYSHYQEGRRDGFYRQMPDQATTSSSLGVSNTYIPNNRNPIEVDGLHGSAHVSITDHIKFAFNYQQDTWSGATPIGTAPAPYSSYYAKVIQYDDDGHVLKTGASPYAQATATVNSAHKFINTEIDLQTGNEIYSRAGFAHVMSYASPETRKQGDFKLSYQWDEAAIDIGGGISVENDYESRFVNLGGRMDFNQKLTTVDLSLSYTNSEISADLDPIGDNYFRIEGYQSQITSNPVTGQNTLHGTRQDWASHLGLSQVINKDAIANLGLTYTRSTSFMENPYKLTWAFGYDLLNPQNNSYSTPIGILTDLEGASFIEQRPDVRNLLNWSVNWTQFVAPLHAALHLDYTFAHDDWGINAHTFQADWVQPLGLGWSITPRVRYYSQSAADFYTPSIITTFKTDGTQVLLNAENFPIYNLPDNFSSDQRLSGYGTLSGGVTLHKKFAKGVDLEAGFEYYTHQGDLKLGGGGEGSFADFDYWVANASLKVNLAAIGQSMHYDGHQPHDHQSHSAIPAGVLFGHTLEKAGDMMVGYRYQRSWQGGGFLRGSQKVLESQVESQGCPGLEEGCLLAPKEMSMNMHMLDIMYAPTDWLTLMLMPQFMDMEMPLYRPGNKPPDIDTHGGVHVGHSGHVHETGGIGDTGMYAMVNLFDHADHHLHLTLGVSAPTGDSEIKTKVSNTGDNYDRDGNYMHYGMQLGSGTWDIKPSLTYTGNADDWSWGAQVAGTKRLESRNSSGFALGDLFESSVWGGYNLTQWLSASLRVAYNWQGGITGGYPTGRVLAEKIQTICPKYQFRYDSDGDGLVDFDNAGYQACIDLVNSNASKYIAEERPALSDHVANYGGHYVDLGLGLSVNIPHGAFQGNRLSFEWLQPVYTNVNGYQLDRDGALSFTWSYGF